VPTKGSRRIAMTVAHSLKRRIFPRNVHMITTKQAASNAFLSIFANMIVKNIHVSSAQELLYANTISGGAAVSIVRVQVYAFIKGKKYAVFSAWAGGYANT